MAKKILLVDDDEDFVTITKSQLQKGGFDVEVAYSGEECIEKVQKEKPDLILLDVMMPGKDGFDVCEQLKTDDNTKCIPIILLTAQTKNECNIMYKKHQDSAIEADDYMKKPLDHNKLIKSINNLINIFDKTTRVKAIDSSSFKEKIVVKGKELNLAFPRDRELYAKATYHPDEYEVYKEMPDGAELLFRPIKPGDEEMLLQMCNAISEETIAYKTFRSINVVPQKIVEELIHTDYANDMAICAVARSNGKEQIVGVGYYNLIKVRNKAEVSFIVRDDWQGRGVSMSILETLSFIAKLRGVVELRSKVITSKVAIMPLFYNIGYIVYIKMDDGTYNVCYEIKRRWSIHRLKDNGKQIRYEMGVD